MNKSEHQQRVELFMQKAGQATPDVPTEPDDKIKVLRAKLVLEECLELIRKGLGIAVSDKGNHVELKIDNLQFDIVDKFDMVEMADGCCDISVVTYGTAIACGVSMKPLLTEVDENNLQKFSSGGYVREDGKLIKPANHPKPRISELLAEQGWRNLC